LSGSTRKKGIPGGEEVTVNIKLYEEKSRLGRYLRGFEKKIPLRSVFQRSKFSGVEATNRPTVRRNDLGKGRGEEQSFFKKAASSIFILIG